MNSSAPLRIATRESNLALWQANSVKDLLAPAVGERGVELVRVSTHGDRDSLEPLWQIGGLGVFTKEVQQAVLDGRADIAVHSLKDLPTEQTEGLLLAGFPSRAKRFDALLLPGGEVCESLKSLSQGARIGTGSLRRRAQLLHVRPDLEMLEIRGNVETRIAKLDAGEYDAIVLACAGLIRLGLEERISLVLEPPEVLPAVGQAALGIECRAEDATTADLLRSITDSVTCAEVMAERACLAALRAGCHAPVGTLTTLEGGTLSMTAVVLSPDGRQRLEASNGTTTTIPSAETRDEAIDAARRLGREVAQQLLDDGADSLIHSTRSLR